jgi:hypothetical protein
MANPEKIPVPDQPEIQLDSLNSEIFEPTDVVIDTTIRPMRESLRKRLKPPPNGERSHEPPTAASP